MATSCIHVLQQFFFLSFFLISLATLFAAQNSGGARGSTAAGELWCVAKNNAEDAALQSALDWACGAGGANCSLIQPGAQCYDSEDIVKTASFAFNDYFLKHGMSPDSCDFSNSAQLTSLNPSHGNCTMPSSSTASKGSYLEIVHGSNGPSSADSSTGNSVLPRSQLAVVMIPLFFMIPVIDP